MLKTINSFAKYQYRHSIKTLGQPVFDNTNIASRIYRSDTCFIGKAHFFARAFLMRVVCQILPEIY
jgi:hypothetical protein